MRILTIVSCIIISVALCGCSSSTNAPETSGSLSGIVFVYKQNSPFSAPYYDGATVQLEGTSFSTLTDSAGHWSISGIPAGAYTVDVTKAGYGLLRWFAVPVFGGGTNIVGPSYLPSLPSDSVHIDAIDTVSNPQGLNIKVSGHSTNSVSWAVFVDLTSDVNPEDSHLLITNAWGTNSTTPLAYVTIQDLLREGMHSGTKVYISACAVSGVGSQGGAYQDPRDGSTRYTACGPKSNVLTYVLP